MRSLTKDPAIINAAQSIVQFFRSRFSQDEAEIEKEMNKLSSEKEILKVMKTDISEKIKK
ncbi:hypothetical protein VSU16_14910 (plasmid) [Cetobacterium somerae]|uniref:hypothetical protein n=1 Tax=Cetobacterium somerae TaxID=188913 RepID=UPI002E7B3188|nr:hypothetical protein [Cetobacterium somerae]WVJ03018.1 hypothetical protein VSU16_14910 [Cetobacterium somerae]